MRHGYQRMGLAERVAVGNPTCDSRARRCSRVSGARGCRKSDIQLACRVACSVMLSRRFHAVSRGSQYFCWASLAAEGYDACDVFRDHQPKITGSRLWRLAWGSR